MTKVIIRTSVSDKGLLTVSDNAGNSLKQESGFIDVSCNGRKQDINTASIAALGAMISERLSRPAFNDIGAKMTVLAVGKAMPVATEIANNIAKTVESFDATVVLRDGLPSPLANLCAAGKQEKLIRDRQ